MPETLTLDGCAPSPLASYLKALGLLRVISSDWNHAKGRAADSKARGWWEGECFHVRTALDRTDLCGFFLHEYTPSPIIAPWNSGSGFYAKDNRDGFNPLAAESVAERFRPLAEAIGIASAVIDRQELNEAPKGKAKFDLVSALRAELPGRSLDWLDAAVALSGRDISYPSLLGTGGNDGRLDFTNNFLRHLLSRPGRGVSGGLFDASSGSAAVHAKPTLVRSLFGSTSRGLVPAAIGQFAPGPAGGANAMSGFSAKGLIDSWDFVLMLEGAVAFAGAATRRHQNRARAPQASFPFSVRVVGAGWGGVDVTEEDDARAEFWAPLWSRPVTFREVGALLHEGRAVLKGRTAGDGLDFARATASLGISRGISEFERYAFLMRAGKAYLATPLGRFKTQRRQRPDLIADLETGGWLAKARHLAGGSKSPAYAKSAMRRLQDALFQMTDAGQAGEGTQHALIALGELVRWMTTNTKVREELPPPPVMGNRWMNVADDGSPEFRVAVALAGVGVTVQTSDRTEPSDGHMTTDAADVGQISQAMPMAAHFASIDEDRFARYRRTVWSASTSIPNVVWETGSLVSNMIAVLERRLIEATIRGLPDKPFASAQHACLPDVAAFLSADFDDSRCAALLAGLIWVRPTHLRANKSAPVFTPTFAYAALKPVFTPDVTLRRIGLLTETARLPVPPGLVARLRSGGNSTDGHATDAAVKLALARARGSGVQSPFDPARSGGRRRVERSRYGAGVAADRLAAALLIPIGAHDLKALVRRAYTDAPTEPSDEHMEDTTDAT